MTAHATAFEHDGERYIVVSRSLARPPAFERLTPAELGVAEGILSGYSIRELAKLRAVSERTIANQSARIYRKLGIVSRHELMALTARVFDPPAT